MSKTEKKGNLLRQYPFATGCLGAAALFAIGLVVRFGAGSEIQAQLDQLSTDGQRMQANVRNSADIEEHVQALKAEVTRLEALLRKVDDVSANQAFFYRLESTTGIRLTVLRPTGAAKEGPKDAAYQRAGFNVVAEGSYVQLIGFLQALEHSASLYQLVDFTLQRSSSSAASGDPTAPLALNLNLQLLATK